MSTPDPHANIGPLDVKLSKLLPAFANIVRAWWGERLPERPPAFVFLATLPSEPGETTSNLNYISNMARADVHVMLVDLVNGWNRQAERNAIPLHEIKDHTGRTVADALADAPGGIEDK